MKILLITTVYKSEAVGPARFARLLVQSPNIDVTVLTSGYRSSDSVINLDFQYPWWASKMKINYSIPHFQRKLSEIEQDYDFLLFNNALLAYELETQTPYAVMVSDAKLMDLNFSMRFDFIRRKLHRRLEKWCCQNAPLIIANSQQIKEKIIDNYGSPFGKIIVLHKGISIADKQRKYDYDQFGSGKAYKILFVKNDYIIGGLLHLLAALSSVTQFVFELTIIGSNRLSEKDLPSADNISYYIKGIVPNEEVITAMYNHDILCIPSDYEPLGVAVMEGLAVGIPTVTTGVGGLPIITRHGEYVWQCQPSSPKSIAKQILKCIENSEERKQKGQNGKAYIQKQFDFGNVSRKLLKIINNESMQ